MVTDRQQWCWCWAAPDVWRPLTPPAAAAVSATTVLRNPRWLRPRSNTTSLLTARHRRAGHVAQDMVLDLTSGLSSVPFRSSDSIFVSL